MEKLKLSALWRYEKQILKYATLNQETSFFVFVSFLQSNVLLLSQSSSY